MNKRQKKKSTKFMASWHAKAGLLAIAVVTAANFMLVGSNSPMTYAAVKNDEADQFARINNERASHGVASLKLSECISRVARQHSYNMSISGGLYHNGQNSQQINEACGVWVYTLAENVVYGGGSSANSANLFQMLLNSPCHHANIDSRTFSYPPCNVTGDYGSQPYSHAGVGSYRDSSARLYITQVFVHCTTGCGPLEQADSQPPLADWTAPAPPPASPGPAPAPPPASPAPTNPAPTNPAPASSTTPATTTPDAPSARPTYKTADNSKPAATTNTVDLPQDIPVIPTTRTAQSLYDEIPDLNISFHKTVANLTQNQRAAASTVLLTMILLGLYSHHAGILNFNSTIRTFRRNWRNR